LCVKKGGRFIHVGVTVHVAFRGRPTEISPHFAPSFFLVDQDSISHPQISHVCTIPPANFTCASLLLPRPAPSNSLMLLLC
jgi:hypothetical protein